MSQQQTTPVYQFSYAGGVVNYQKTYGSVKFLLFLIGNMKETPIWELKKLGLVTTAAYYIHKDILHTLDDNVKLYLPTQVLPEIIQQQYYYLDLWTTSYRILKLFVSQNTSIVDFKYSFYLILEPPQQATARIEIGCPPPQMFTTTRQERPPNFYLTLFGRFLTRKEVKNILSPTSLSWKLYDAQKYPNIEFLKSFVKVTLKESAIERMQKQKIRKIRLLNT